MVFPYKGWVFENFGTHLDEWVGIGISVEKGQDTIDVGGRVGLVM